MDSSDLDLTLTLRPPTESEPQQQPPTASAAEAGPSREMVQGDSPNLWKKIRVPYDTALRIYELTRQLNFRNDGETVHWLLCQAQPIIIASTGYGTVPAGTSSESVGYRRGGNSLSVPVSMSIAPRFMPFQSPMPFPLPIPLPVPPFVHLPRPDPVPPTLGRRVRMEEDYNILESNFRASRRIRDQFLKDVGLSSNASSSTSRAPSPPPQP